MRGERVLQLLTPGHKVGGEFPSGRASRLLIMAAVLILQTKPCPAKQNGSESDTAKERCHVYSHPLNTETTLLGS